MSQTIAAVFVQLLTLGLPIIGVTIGTDDLTKATQVVVLIATSFCIWYRRASQGDVNAFGVRK